MVMEINVLPGIKAKIKTMVRDAAARGLNVSNARDGDIKIASAQAPL